MRRDTLLTVMKRAKKGNMQGDIVTNGTLLGEKEVEEIVKIGWDRMQISIDGPDAKTHDYLRGKKGTFGRVLRTIELFRRKKEEWEKDKPKLDASTVLSKVNYKRLPELLELISLMGMRGLNLQPIQRRTSESEKLKLNKEEIKEFNDMIGKCERIRKENNIEADIEIFERRDMVSDSFNLGKKKEEEVEKNEGLLSIPCHLPLINISISEDGYVEPCEQLNFKEENVKNKTLQEIWQGDFFTSVRDSFREGNLFDECKNCCGSQVIETEELRKRLKNFDI